MNRNDSDRNKIEKDKTEEYRAEAYKIEGNPAEENKNGNGKADMWDSSGESIRMTKKQQADSEARAEEDSTGKPYASAGLGSEEVRERIELGLVNRTNLKTGRSVGKIIQSNLLTYFNLIFLIIAVLLCMVESFRNLTFLPVIIVNTLAGIVQELRAKRTLDKMNMLNAPYSVVIRDGRESRIPSEELVKDDCILLTSGNQICADASVVEGSISVNESLLTGEADEIRKEVGSQLLSGSFVVSGRCCAKLEKVGEESYISRLTAEAKAMGDKEQSEMIRSLNRLLKWIGIIIVPIAAILFGQAYLVNQETFQKSVVSVIAAVIGMIPEGLYLLTTVSLTLSTVRLAGKKVLLHDMKSIETLARVDVLCVDKTGTITEPGMEVTELLPSSRSPQGPMEKKQLEALLRDYAWAVQDNNATMEAICAYGPVAAGGEEGRRRPLSVMPFSSARKYSRVSFEDGNYVLGAPEFLLRRQETAGEAEPEETMPAEGVSAGEVISYESVLPEISGYLKKGYRVLMLGKYGEESTAGEEALCRESVIPLGYVILTNPIRENAMETFAYFREQGVTVKVISGDNAETVSEVAKRAGIADADRYIDAGRLENGEELEKAAEQYTVFGRVTPSQKQLLVRSLQKKGHTVAMTGDGVNDILAMKDADCSVAMASGSEAAAQAAQLVLLDSDFARMPSVVLEGRQVVNNIQRSASLFLVKNIFSLLMALFSAVFAITYPLEPAQISLISMFTIGAPGFLLALEPNRKRIEGRFIRNVLVKAVPAGLTDMFIVCALVTCGKILSLPERDIATASTILLAIVGFMMLVKISRPFHAVKYGILALNVGGLLFCWVFLSELFAMGSLSPLCILLTVVFGFAAESLFRYLGKATERFSGRDFQKKLAAMGERRRKRLLLRRENVKGL